MEREIIRYEGCFVCGDKNPSGLNLRFFSDGRITRTRYTPSTHHEGYKGIVHGGIVATIMDEVMIKAILALDIRSVTASMEFKFRAPAIVGEELHFEGEIISQKGRVIKTAGSAKTKDGRVIAEATAVYVRPSDELDHQLRQSIET